MRSLHELRRAVPARRTPVLVLVLMLVLPTALLTVVAGPGASAETTGTTSTTSRDDRPGPAADRRSGDPMLRTAPRDLTHPDFIDMPDGCFSPDPYVLSTKPCRLTPHRPGAPLIVLWGDSHAWMMTPAIRRAVRGKRVNVVSLMQGACPVMNSDLSTPKKYAARNGCDTFGHDVIKYLDKARSYKRPLRVIVAMAWELYHNVTDPLNDLDKRYPGFDNDYIRVNARKSLNGTPRAFKALSRMRIRTDIVAAQPMVYQTAPQCPDTGFRCPLPRWAVLKDAVENNARVREMRSLLRVKGSVIRPARSLCTKTECRGKIDGVPTYYDRIHIGQRASYRLASHFAPTVSSVLREAADRRRTSR